MAQLLAIDVGLHTGLALYDDTPTLRWYRSHHLGSPARLRRAVCNILNAVDDLTWLVLEGSGALADIWEREAARRHLPVICISAETWRGQLLYGREQRSGAQAKLVADGLARRVINWSVAPQPTSLRHDAAEAILIGLWGLLEVGWLDGVPPELRR